MLQRKANRFVDVILKGCELPLSIYIYTHTFGIFEMSKMISIRWHRQYSDTKTFCHIRPQFLKNRIMHLYTAFLSLRCFPHFTKKMHLHPFSITLMDG